MTDEFEGRCSCGDVTYRMTSRPMITHCCHCRYCQRETGASFAVNAIIEADRVELLSGSLEETTFPSESGKGLIVVRCSSCKLPVWTHYGQNRFIRWVRVGTLNDPDLIEPDVHIFTRSKQPWVIIPEGVPSFEASYSRDPNTVYSAESLERNKAVAAKRAASKAP